MLNIKHERQMHGLSFIDMVSQRDRERFSELVKRGFAGKTSSSNTPLRRASTWRRHWFR